MRRNLFIILLILFAVCSCAEQEDKHMDMDELVKYFMKERMAVSIEEDSLVNVKNLKSICQDTSFVYLLNSSCSMCLYQFVEFYQYEHNMCGIPVTAVIDEGRMPQLEYVLDKSGIDLASPNLVIVENLDSMYVHGNIENLDLSGVLISIKGDNARYACQYIGDVTIDL